MRSPIVGKTTIVLRLFLKLIHEDLIFHGIDDSWRVSEELNLVIRKNRWKMMGK